MFFSRPDRIQGLVHPELPIFVTMSVPDNEEKDARTTAIEINKFLYSIVYVNIEILVSNTFGPKLQEDAFNVRSRVNSENASEASMGSIPSVPSVAGVR